MALELPPRAELLEYLLSFDLFEQLGNVEEGVGYARHHVDRFVKTLEWIPKIAKPVRVLELGASPYFMSVLVMKYLGYDVTPANFFGDYGEQFDHSHSMVVTSKRFGESYVFAYRTFNVESERFPYRDGEFDLVLCCEILEHLARSPGHLLREAHRVLKPGGRVLISTPNAIRIENVVKLLRGENVYPAYSGYGVYGRHNREYTPWELGELLKANHFEPDVIVDDAYPHGALHRFATKFGSLRRRRDNLFAIGTRIGSTVERHPEWLVEHRFGAPRARTTYVIMGDEEHDQLAGGWSDFEYGPPGVRWIEREARVWLKPNGNEVRVGFRAERATRAVRGRILVNGEVAAEFELAADRAHEVIAPLPARALELIQSGAIHFYDVAIQVDERSERSLAIEKLGLLA